MQADTFMGHPFNYWVELERQANVAGLDAELITDNALLRAKVSYYESLFAKAAAYKAQLGE